MNNVFEVWILGYDKNGYTTDFDFNVASFANKQLALERAKECKEAEYVKNLIDTLCILTPDNLEQVEVRVEEVEETSPDYFECIDTIYESDFIKIK